MKTKISVITLLFVFAVIAPLAGEFSPAGSDVATGDDRIQKIPGPDRLLRRRRGAEKAKDVSVKHFRGHVFNGVQGGAFILIRVFQVVISPQDGPSCRYSPVCSAYGKQAVERFGAFWGALMAGDRLLRCNPYSPRGPDPVPRRHFFDE